MHFKGLFDMIMFKLVFVRQLCQHLANGKCSNSSCELTLFVSKTLLTGHYWTLDTLSFPPIFTAQVQQHRPALLFLLLPWPQSAAVVYLPVASRPHPPQSKGGLPQAISPPAQYQALRVHSI